MVSEAAEAHLSSTAAVLEVLESLHPKQQPHTGVSTWHRQPMETRPSSTVILTTGEARTFPGAPHPISVIIFPTELDRRNFWSWLVCGAWLVLGCSRYADTKTFKHPTTPHIILSGRYRELCQPLQIYACSPGAVADPGAWRDPGFFHRDILMSLAYLWIQMARKSIPNLTRTQVPWRGAHGSYNQTCSWGQQGWPLSIGII